MDMALEKTTVEWTYEPKDLSEVPFSYPQDQFNLEFEGGTATATLAEAQDPAPEGVLALVEETVRAILAARMLLVHRPYSLTGPRVRQHRCDGSQHVVLQLRVAAVIASAGTLDAVARDADFITLITDAAGKHPLMKSLLSSYSAAVADPEDELVHLYEIRDALWKRFGKGTRDAIRSLGVEPNAWSRLGQLANDEPLKQGRHRGQHADSLRSATDQELQEARQVARDLIEAFARTL